jgi:voltage-gated potassium channel
MHAFHKLRRAYILALSLILFALLGTAGFHFIEHWSWFDSFYMVVITLSTVGYAEVHPLSHHGRIFNLFVILTGVGLLLVSIGMLSAALLEFELTQFFGRRRMERQIAKLEQHYIICGAGRVGRSAAREFASGNMPFVVIDSRPEKTSSFPEEWLVIQGDATQEKVLREARIESAAGLIAATTTDASNIFIVLNAREMNPKLRIIARASEEDAAKHLRKVGADYVVSPYISAGHRIAHKLLRPNLVDFFDITDEAENNLGMVIEEFTIPHGSYLHGTTLGSSRIHGDFGIMVVAVKGSGGQTVLNPSASATLHAGDLLILLGKRDSVTQFGAAAGSRR